MSDQDTEKNRLIAAFADNQTPSGKNFEELINFIDTNNSESDGCAQNISLEGIEIDPLKNQLKALVNGREIVVTELDGPIKLAETDFRKFIFTGFGSDNVGDIPLLDFTDVNSFVTAFIYQDKQFEIRNYCFIKNETPEQVNYAGNFSLDLLAFKAQDFSLCAKYGTSPQGCNETTKMVFEYTLIE